MAEGERCEMGIGREVSGGAGATEEGLQYVPVLILLAHDPHIVPGEPGVELRGRHVGREGTRKHAWIRGQPQEAEQHHPGQADGVLVVDPGPMRFSAKSSLPNGKAAARPTPLARQVSARPRAERHGDRCVACSAA